MLVVFTAINMLNYVDRGIIPGAPVQLGEFISDDIHVEKTKTYIGFLQSSFIAGYAVASVVFGHLVHYFNPFKLMTVGLFIWVAAVAASGLAPHFGLLIVARIFSGVGEASFQTVVPPFIDDRAPKSKRALWLAIFFSAIPVGTAAGYGFGAVMATTVGWRYAFFLEGLMMVPMATLVWFFPYRRSESEGTVTVRDEEPPSMISELKSVITRPVYLCVVLGYASYTFVTAGFAAFGPTFMLQLKEFTDEEAASLSFGALVSTAGFVGTPLGGWLLDRGQKGEGRRDVVASKGRDVARVPVGRDVAALELDMDAMKRDGADEPDSDDSEESAEERSAKFGSALAQLGRYSIVAFGFIIFTPFFTEKGLFFALLFCGCVALFATTSAVNLSIMSSVPQGSRSFAIGVSTVIMHSLGDVPSPTIIGWLDDTLSKPTVVLLLVVLWLLWTVFFWCLAWLLFTRGMATRGDENELSSKLLTPQTGEGDGEVDSLVDAL